ncbi:MAG: ethanolamine utilization protein EutA [Dehalococcoidia bacterium]|nr:ethanolamine utilization protein EutA [Dehalococcoidia bacterium]
MGVDIGSSTSHLIFSRLTLDRVLGRYVTTNRTSVFESETLLTPYTGHAAIDGDALGRFVAEQYRRSGIERPSVDTGALILTGVALLRDNARAIADVFAQEGGRFVAVSAGDNIEALMAAHSSGAIALSERTGQTALNVAIGGGTTKLVRCEAGRATAVAALDVGARLVVTTPNGVITRLEPAGRAMERSLGLKLELGATVGLPDLDRLADHMAQRVLEAMGTVPMSEATRTLLRTPPLPQPVPIDAVTFSGGVSEYVYGNEAATFGDLGPQLAAAVLSGVQARDLTVIQPTARIRATVTGASQYTVQVSGSTIYLSPPDVTPLRDVPVVAPPFDFGDGETGIDAAAVAGALAGELRRFDLDPAAAPVAVAVRWRGSARFDDDVGGLLGIHLNAELGVTTPIASIDGIDLRAFDYIDIGSLIATSGAVPVVIKVAGVPQRVSHQGCTTFRLDGECRIMGPDDRECTRAGAPMPGNGGVPGYSPTHNIFFLGVRSRGTHPRAGFKPAPTHHL